MLPSSSGCIPTEVNSWAYAVGAENQDTFNPVSYGQACNHMPWGGGCNPATEGYLSRNDALGPTTLLTTQRCMPIWRSRVNPSFS